MDHLLKASTPLSENVSEFPVLVKEQAEIQMKYEGYISKRKK